MFDVVSQTVTDIKSYVSDLYYFFLRFLEYLFSPRQLLTSYNVNHKILSELYAWRELSDDLKDQST